MNQITLTFPGKPKALQSFRVAQIGGFARKYQPKEVVQWKNYLMILAREQLPPDFAVFTGVPLKIEMAFIFLLPKSAPKRMRVAVDAGERVWKITKPDVTDNLPKGVVDALAGIVYSNDCIISDSHPLKYYGLEEKTIVRVTEIEGMAY